MKNEIGRKLTSLTLMTIMVAGGLTFAIPGVMPLAEASHNANLYVSAENSQYSNYFNGPMVIEVVVIDPDIDDTDEGKGEPIVSVNGADLRMVQAVDGNWYGYFADRTQAQQADSTQPTGVQGNQNGTGLNFGTFCDNDSGAVIQDGATVVDLGDTVGFAVPLNNTAGGVDGTATIEGATCVAVDRGPSNTNATLQHVIRESKAINTNAAIPPGQIGVDPAFWPFIQLYNINPTGNVIIQYAKGGGAQATTLTFDTVDQFAGMTNDRDRYPQGSMVHLTMTDVQLNIDPTDEDSWTWGSTGDGVANGTFYQLFNENGDADADIAPLASGSRAAQDLAGNLSAFACEDNCIFILDTDTQNVDANVLIIVDNDDSGTTGTITENPINVETLGAAITAPGHPVTFTELSPNSGIFSNYDESDVANLQINQTALRGTSGTVDYNEVPVSIIVGFEFASLDIVPNDDEWNSGETVAIVLTDADSNKNSRVDEDLDLNSPTVDLIPALRTGTPFTLGFSGDDLSATGDTRLIAVFSETAPSIGTGVGWPGDNVGTCTPANCNLRNYTGSNTPGSPLSTLASTVTVQAFSDRLEINPTGTGGSTALVIDLNATMADLLGTITDPRATTIAGFHGTNLFNVDVRGITNASDTIAIYLGNVTTSTGGIIDTSTPGVINATATWQLLAGPGNNTQTLVSLNSSAQEQGSIENLFAIAGTDDIGLLIDFGTGTIGATNINIVADFFSFGFTDDGADAGERISNQIIRIEMEESGDNTGVFEGELEYVSVNQLNILVEATYLGLSTIADDPTFIVIEDLTDEDAPRANYADLGEDGTVLPVADQLEAPTHSGTVSFDLATYKIADTVVVTLNDPDLNADSDLTDIFTVVRLAGDVAIDTIGAAGLPQYSFGDLGHMLDITFDDVGWVTPTGTCLATMVTADTGLGATGFTLIETGTDTGVFVGDFAVPGDWCRSASQTGGAETTTGLDIEVNYLDFRDASGEIIEVGDSAGIRANTGSVSLDRTVYPVPFGVPTDFTAPTTPSSNPVGRSVFPVHQTGAAAEGDTAFPVLDTGEFIAGGDLIIHVRINDPDFDISPDGEDVISRNTTSTSNRGLLKVDVLRGADIVTLGYGAGTATVSGVIDAGTKAAVGSAAINLVNHFGPLTETAPDSGIFELDLTIRWSDGPASATCPSTGVQAIADRFDDAGTTHCILQGDILQVEYTDPEDASGDVNTVTDSASFDLRNGVLQSDKSVYIIGSDLILTLIEPDFDLENDGAETYDLDLIEWDSDAADLTMGNLGGTASSDGLVFDPEPTSFRETGDSTGIFQIVIEIPEALGTESLERGEEIILEYTDWGPSGSDFVGDEDEDINLTIFTSNFGATVELDQKVYTWTDKVYITIVAPDHNFDSDLVDEIGNTATDPIKVSTRGFDINQYKLVETGTDTGIFTGEVILTGFAHDADGDLLTGTSGTGVDTTPFTSLDDTGPTDGLLQTDDDDGLTVSFEFSEDETVVGSALVRWNIGETNWLEASYPASGTGVVRIVDPDMNLDPEAVDNFDVDVWSDSDAGGIDLTVTETNEATGIFEGTVFFTTTDESSGHRLRVSEGDTITAEYEDNTLPDPYTTADELDITGTSLIGTIVPPLERAPAANARVVDAFGNALSSVSVDQQVQISADLANGQDRDQAFAYLVQVQDGNGVTVSLAWITGSLAPGQSFSPALSWTPDAAGTYTATVFVWESVDSPTALSPPTSTEISVS